VDDVVRSSHSLHTQRSWQRDQGGSRRRTSMRMSVWSRMPVKRTREASPALTGSGVVIVDCFCLHQFVCCRLGSSCGVVSYLARRRVPTPSAAGASPCSPAAASLSPRVPAAFARRDGEGERRGGRYRKGKPVRRHLFPAGAPQPPPLTTTTTASPSVAH
jgi:hypothetical protein